MIVAWHILVWLGSLTLIAGEVALLIHNILVALHTCGPTEAEDRRLRKNALGFGAPGLLMLLVGAGHQADWL